MKPTLLALAFAACTPVPESTTSLPTFEPVSVGFAFDGVVLSDGTLAAYQYAGAVYDPAVLLVFASDAYFTGGDPYAESCAVIASYAPAPLPSDAPLATADDSPLFFGYDATIAIDGIGCAGRVDPTVYGDDASGLWGPFDGARFGLGFGPMTDPLLAEWDAEVIDEVGVSMIAEWIGVEAADGTLVATDWTTALWSAWDEASGDLLFSEDAEGNQLLVPVDVTGLVPGDVLPAGYTRSYPTVYPDLATFTE
ncbi:MAG: hypothetical protein ABMB14_03490 [Myxococcota bacterium]